ncbi:hypothetical protein ACTMU2_09655 [Cupriavidus basilensis]
MRRIPAEPGGDGIDVFGKALAADPLKTRRSPTGLPVPPPIRTIRTCSSP